jgi:hypothetical protein
MDNIHSDNTPRTRPEPRPYFGEQEPEFGEGGGFGKHEDEPRFGKFGGQVGGRGPTEPATQVEARAEGPHAQPQKNFAQMSRDGKYEGGESTGGYADHRDKQN